MTSENSGENLSNYLPSFELKQKHFTQIIFISWINHWIHLAHDATQLSTFTINITFYNQTFP